jgi:hypothetical protein
MNRAMIKISQTEECFNGEFYEAFLKLIFKHMNRAMRKTSQTEECFNGELHVTF